MRSYHQQQQEEGSNSNSHDNNGRDTDSSLGRPRANTSVTVELSDAGGDSSEELQVPRNNNNTYKNSNNTNDDDEDGDLEQGLPALSDPSSSSPTNSSTGDDDDDEEDVVVDYLAEMHNDDDEDNGIIWVPAPGEPAPTVCCSEDGKDAVEESMDANAMEETKTRKEDGTAAGEIYDVEKATNAPTAVTLQNKDYHARTQTCSICLCHMEENDQVSWSANTSCSHAFHTDCVHSWLAMAARKHLKRQRRRQARTGNIIMRDDPITNILKVPMLCPCCRQPFLKSMDGHDDDKDAESNAGSTRSNAEVQVDDQQPQPSSTSSSSGSSGSGVLSTSLPFLETSSEETSSQQEEQLAEPPSSSLLVETAREMAASSSSSSSSWATSSPPLSSWSSLAEGPEPVHSQHQSSPATGTRPTTAELAVSAMC